MEIITKERLIKAGWHKERRVDIEEIEKKYDHISLKMPANVRKFFRQYAFLSFDDESRKIDLEFDPIKAIGCNLDKEYFMEMLEEYDIFETVYPIGLACRGNLFVLMTANNTFYLYTNGYLESCGESVEEMLACLIGECQKGKIIE